MLPKALDRNRKVSKGCVLGIGSGLLFFFLVNLFLTVDPSLRISLINIFSEPQVYRLAVLEFLKTLILVSLAGGTIGALTGCLVSLARTRGIFVRLVRGIIAGALWGVVSGVIIFHDIAGALGWALLIGIPWALLIAVLLR